MKLDDFIFYEAQLKFSALLGFTLAKIKYCEIYKEIHFSERIVYFLIKSILEEKLGAERVETKQDNLCNWSSTSQDIHSKRQSTLH